MNITPLQTTYAGIRFRSRTEARWAVFFDGAGIKYRYENEGFHVRTGYYLPDFWLPDLHLFMEIKGAEPTDEEKAKCAELAEKSEADMLLAIGPPEEHRQLLWFDRGGQRDDLFVLARDRMVKAGFWLVGEETVHHIGPNYTAGLPRGPMLSGSIEDAYLAAKAERFDGIHKRRPIAAFSDDPDRMDDAA